jgi:hypothetical protein
MSHSPLSPVYSLHTYQHFPPYFLPALSLPAILYLCPTILDYQHLPDLTLSPPAVPVPYTFCGLLTPACLVICLPLFNE